MPNRTVMLKKQLKEIDNAVSAIVTKMEEEHEDYWGRVMAQIHQYKESGDSSGLQNILNSSENNSKQSLLKDDSNSKANASELKTDEAQSTRPRRKAFDEATQLVNQQINQSVEIVPPIKKGKRGRKKKETIVKTERTSSASKHKVALNTRSTRSTSQDVHRDSDVILKPNKIPFVNLDSDDEEEAPRSTRTKKKVTKSVNSDGSSLDEKLESAKAKKKVTKAAQIDKKESVRSTKNTNKHIFDSDSEEELINKSESDESLASVRGKVLQSKPNIDEMEPIITKKSTRTKKSKVEASKRLRSPSNESAKKSANKRTKRKEIADARKLSQKTQNGDDDTVYEDAIATALIHAENSDVKVVIERISTPKENVETVHIKKDTPTSINLIDNQNKTPAAMNETVVITKKTPAQMNETVVLERKTPMNETVVLDKKTPMNETVVLEKITPVQMNATVVIEKKTPAIEKANTPILNETVVIEKGVELNNLNENIADIMTDDESMEEPLVAKKTKIAAKTPKQPVFNVFENSPVKKKIQAFEQLQVESLVDAPARMTRTKTKAKVKATEAIEQSSSASSRTSSNASQIPVSMLKMTPVSNKTNPLNFGSHSKMVIGNSSISTKSASALKAAREEYRAREIRRQEKEEEALKKRQAFKLAQIEERRLRREEKELKAKQIRDELEKEKQYKIELQLARDEKQKQLALAERAEKQQRLREEAEKKRILAKQRYEERKHEEEKRRLYEERALKKKEAEDRLRADGKLNELERMKAAEKKKNLPIYMTQKAPLLPSYNCYDSDDPEAAVNPQPKPDWCRRDKLDLALESMLAVDQKLKNTFFCLQPTSPDLTKIFQHLDPAKLKRNSSAIWKHAPRFTLMPDIEDV